MLSRRSLALGIAAALALRPEGAAAARVERELRDIGKRIGGRLGVHALDSQSGKRAGLDDKSRFALASTFKLPLAAALLWQIDHKAFGPRRALPIASSDLLGNSPTVQARFQSGATEMPIIELCEAAVVMNDDAAANILLRAIGGPAALTTFLRSAGDTETRLDRTEPALNGNLPDDPRDTTTPRAFVDLMLTLFTQQTLSITSRAVLIDWLQKSQTGVDRVRAGLPRSWLVGDQTGTGENGAFNDVVVAFPPQRRPVFVAVYMSGSALDVRQLAAAHAQIGALIPGALGL